MNAATRARNGLAEVVNAWEEPLMGCALFVIYNEAGVGLEIDSTAKINSIPLFNLSYGLQLKSDVSYFPCLGFIYDRKAHLAFIVVLLTMHTRAMKSPVGQIAGQQHHKVLAPFFIPS